jgi:hypothetical protein
MPDSLKGKKDPYALPDADMMQKEFKALRKKTLGKVLEMKFKGANDYWKFIADMELQRRAFVRDKLIDRYLAGFAIFVSIGAVIVSVSSKRFL